MDADHDRENYESKLWHDENADECWQCGGEGWGIIGDDFPNMDPVNDPDGEVEKCPCCGGTGKAEDCTYW